MPTIKLVSYDNREFTVDLEVAKLSTTLANMLEDLGLEDGEEEAIPLPNVSGDILEKVIAWAQHHKDDLEESFDEIGDWDENFLKVDKQVLFALARAANYLDIKGLLDLICKAVANLIKEQQPKELRKLFDLADLE